MSVSIKLTLMSIMAVLLILFLMRPASAGFDFSVLLSAPFEVIQCMEKRLSPEAMEMVRSGKRAKSRSMRKSIKKAYEKCSANLKESNGIVRYDGLLFDAMSQIDEKVNMNRAMTRVRAAGVSKLALFARSRKKLHQNEQAVINLAKRNPDLIVLGAPKYFQLSGDVSDDYIRATVNGIKKYGYRFIGELLYTHGDKKSGKQYARGERYVDPSRPGTVKLLEAIAPFSIPFMAHWEPYAPKRDFPKFHALYSAWPDQIFLLPHMGFSSPEIIEDFMSKHSNLYLLTSKKERFMSNFSDSEKQSMIGSAMLDGERLRTEWRKLLIKYQDRILFGTDPHKKKLWHKYGEVVNNQRLILGQLPPDVAENIAYKNAEKIYGVSIDPK